MDYSQFLVLKEELSLVAVIVILFVADLLVSTDAPKKTGGMVRVSTALPVILLAIHTIVNFVPGSPVTAFGGMYQSLPMISIVKSILNTGTLIVFLTAHEWMKCPDAVIKRGEFYILTLCTLLGMYFMISAGHFLLFFIGLEMAS
ncbi:NAD(P)H-quinone oxidoreductase subunit 2, partial [termite gut metagenome]